MALDNVKNILLVLSGKGGVGKSSITTQLALSLSLAGHSVGVLDIDLTGPSIPRFLGIESAKIKQAPGGWLPVEVHPSHNLASAPPSTYPSNHTTQNGVLPDPTAGTAHYNAPPADATAATSAPQHANPIGALYAMSLAFLLSSRSSAIVWRGPKKTAMVRQFLSDVLWPPLDFLLIDTPPGTSDEHISVVETLLNKVHSPATATPLAMNGANGTNGVPGQQQRVYPCLAGAVVVTTPQAVAVSDVKKEINFCAKTGVGVVGVVENMSGYVCPCCGVASNIFSKGGGQIMAAEFGVGFLGGVPIDALWGQLVEEGVRPVYLGEELVRGEVDGEEGQRGVRESGGEEGGEGEGAHGEKEGENMEEEVQHERPWDEALLVDKYRSCSLYPVFQQITRKVVETVENGTAVLVKPPMKPPNAT